MVPLLQGTSLILLGFFHPTLCRAGFRFPVTPGSWPIRIRMWRSQGEDSCEPKIWQTAKPQGTLPETNSLPLKMVVSKFGISKLPGVPQFQGLLLLVSGRVTFKLLGVSRLGICWGLTNASLGGWCFKHFWNVNFLQILGSKFWGNLPSNLTNSYIFS